MGRVSLVRTFNAKRHNSLELTARSPRSVSGYTSQAQPNKNKKNNERMSCPSVAQPSLLHPSSLQNNAESVPAKRGKLSGLNRNKHPLESLLMPVAAGRPRQPWMGHPLEHAPPRRSQTALPTLVSLLPGNSTSSAHQGTLHSAL